MRRKTAGLVFLGVCVMLAALQLTGTISIALSGTIFAISLVVIGLSSGGFKQDESKDRKL